MNADKTPTPVSGIDGSAEPAIEIIRVVLEAHEDCPHSTGTTNWAHWIGSRVIARFGTRPAAEPPVIAAPVEARPSNWHRHHVAVEKAALQMIRNALRTDAESGRSVRAEMLEMLDAATHELAAPTLAEPAQQDTRRGIDPTDPPCLFVGDEAAPQASSVQQAGAAEAVGWKELFWQVALALNCLPSSYLDGNEHVLRSARGEQGVLTNLLRECVGPLEVSAAIFESDDAAPLDDLIERVKAVLTAIDRRAALAADQKGESND